MGLLTALAFCCLALGGCTTEPSPGRVIVLAIDGLDPGAIDLLMSEDKMPGFAKLRQEGAYGRLISSKPILSPVIWTTIATGKEPHEHGIGHFVTINEKTGEQLPVTSQMRRVKALWNILSDAGRKVAVVGWWATWPAETVNGSIVSDHTCYHFLFQDGFDASEDSAGITYPAELEAAVTPFIKRPDDLTFAELRPHVSVSEDEFSKAFAFDDALGHFKWARATADSYKDIGLELWRRERPDTLMVYVEGVDSTSHLFGHLFRREKLAGELAEQQKRFGNTVESMYLYADRIVSEYLDVMDDDTTLVVLSDHGFDLGVLHDDPSKTRDMRRVSERYHKIEGILYMYGKGITPRARIDAPTLLDITPTLLALGGVSPARDMQGRILTEALAFPAPDRTVGTFETGQNRVAEASGDSAPVDPAILEHLRSLGYLDTSSPTGDRNMAAMHFQAGRFEEAAKLYRTLIEEKPDDGALRTSLAGTLASLGNYEEAVVELAEAERLQPLNAEIYHNRGAIFERQGKAAEAVEEYRKAVRYVPDYEPSRRALARLTGSPEADAPATDAEKLASAIAQRAREAAIRGDYKAALEQLDQAQQIAPSFARIYQYRSNVAYLMGDRDGAIAALEKALELEPGHALYRANLENLRNPPAPEGASD